MRFTSATESLFVQISKLSRDDHLRRQTDGKLLDCFVQDRDEAAFEELLRRHGRMVWTICVRTLGNTPHAEDVFQAVFLIVVRKASSLRKMIQIAGWICATTYRVVRKAQQQQFRRSNREQGKDILPDIGYEDESSRDWLPILDRALEKLPTKYRDALILCELQERSRTEAAALLQINENTLSSRLARAKEMLRSRLAPTGVALLSGSGMLISVPGHLSSATMQMIRLTWQSTSQVLPLAIESLLHGGIVSMTKTKIALILGCATLFSITSWIGIQSTTTGNAQSIVPKTSSTKQLLPSSDPVQLKGPQSNEIHTTSTLPKPSEPRSTSDDSRRFQGRWRVKESGNINPDMKVEEVHIEGDRMFALTQKGAFDMTFKLASEWNPKRIDLMSPVVLNKSGEPTSKPTSYYGSYTFDGNQLVIVCGSDRNFRPNVVDSDKNIDGNDFAIVLEPLSSNASGEADTPTELIGNWTITSCTASDVKYEQLRILGNRLCLGSRGVFETVSYRLDTSKNPKWISLEGSLFGIYQLKGNALTLCFRDKRRPSEFESSDKDTFLIQATRSEPTVRDVPIPSNLSTPLPTTPSAPNTTFVPIESSIPTSVPDHSSMPRDLLPTVSVGQTSDRTIIDLIGRDITVPIQIDPKRIGQLKTLRLYVSDDRGEKWQQSHEIAVTPEMIDREPQFQYTAPRSGEYWFALQTVQVSGEAEPITSNLHPQLKVRMRFEKVMVAPITVSGPKATVPDQTAKELKRENDELRQQLRDVLKRIDALEKKLNRTEKN